MSLSEPEQRGHLESGRIDQDTALIRCSKCNIPIITNPDRDGRLDCMCDEETRYFATANRPNVDEPTVTIRCGYCDDSLDECECDLSHEPLAKQQFLENVSLLR